MPSIHPFGTFCWYDLMSSDPAKAKAFYAKLLGWSFRDDDMGGGMIYSHCLRPKADGSPGEVAGMGQLPPDMQAAGVPSNWTPAVHVPDCAAACAKATELGATVIAGPMEIPGPNGAVIGHYGVFRDPQGGHCCVWQSGLHTGADFKDGEEGTGCWTELSSTDLAGSKDFYGKLFGWDICEGKAGDEPYIELKTAGTWVGGMMATKAPAGVPSFWLAYFAVPDVDKSVALALEMGAAPMFEAMNIPGIGRIAGLMDPTGAGFALWTKGK